MNEKTVRAVGEILAERQRQDSKWGIQDHDLPVWLTVLTEEVGDVAGAILEERALLLIGEPRDDLRRQRLVIREEMIQVAAVAVAAVEYLDRHTCSVCGCTDEAGCQEGCWWVEPGLCSRCERLAPPFLRPISKAELEIKKAELEIKKAELEIKAEAL